MRLFDSYSSRRRFLGGLAAAGGVLLTAPGAFADELVRTPKQTEGPFYPNKLPLDTDNDLLIVNDSITPAVGKVTHLTGRVLDAKGNPVRNALVEIWQCDAKGVYLHTGDSDHKKDQQDKHFQGFGRFLTGSTGEYYFRTIKPVPYPGRTPHIHFKIKQGRKALLALAQPGTTTKSSSTTTTVQYHRSSTVIGTSFMLGTESVGKVTEVVFNDGGCIEYLVVQDAEGFVVVPYSVATINYEQKTV